MRFSDFWKIVGFFFALSACNQVEEASPQFRLVKAEESGVDFINQLTVNENMNIITYMYFYNGGGVSIEDFNGDGWLDIYFTSNQESNRLYLNKGNLSFTEVTETAGVAGLSDAWTTGTTAADVNGDGRMDLYVSMLGNYRGLFATNLLFINQGNDENGVPIFREAAAKYGLDLVGFSTQAAFFDYDLDGDLDLFQLNHSVHSNGTFKEKKLFAGEVHEYAGDRLLQNDNGLFKDVSAEAGIIQHAGGYGLGLGVSDLNGDGFPDIYIGNDFHEDDYLYINNQDGTFSEQLQEQTRLTSRYSMGNDLCDINNDGMVDILSMDMLPKDYEILVRSQTEDPYDIFLMKQQLGYGYQYSRNTLQLNNGNNTFTEIGRYSGIYASDWSWSGLVADFDLDQKQDIFISNGIPKRPNDLDYVKFISDSAAHHTNLQYGNKVDLSLIEKMPELKISNLMYAGTASLQFADVSQKWGLDINSYSSGSAYGDLDNDGDLDLVVNNTFDEAFLFENLTIQTDREENPSFLKFQLTGYGQNTKAIGAKIKLFMQSGEIQMKEVYPTRGFQSSVPSHLHFGIAKQDQVDSIQVLWPDRSYCTITEYQLNQTLQIDYSSLARSQMTSDQKKDKQAAVVHYPLTYTHVENKSFNEFAREPLLPHSQAAEGPSVAVGDVNGDGLEDLYLGGAKHQTSVLYLQKKEGFEQIEQFSFLKDSIQEEVVASFVDVDQDGDLDLSVLTGGNEFYRDNPERAPKLYINQGEQFKPISNPFNGLQLTGGAMAWCDYDQDGLQEVFIASRATPWEYGKPTSGYLLDSNESGTYSINMDAAPLFKELGSIKDAQWGDLNGDGFKDLVVAGEWGLVHIFYNQAGNGFTPSEDEVMIKSAGMWNTLELVDLNQDGRLDIVAGNLGTNTKLSASEDFPMQMYVGDFDKNESSENLIYTHREGEYKLFANKDDITKQLIGLKKKYNSYHRYASAEQEEIIPSRWRKQAILREAKELRSCIFLNTENGFQKLPLPKEAQFSPIFDFLPIDLNADGFADLVAGGNYYEVNTQIGKYDSSYGHIFLNNGDGTFRTFRNKDSGLLIKGEVRHIRKLTFQGKPYLLFVRNNDRPAFVKLKELTNEK